MIPIVAVFLLVLSIFIVTFPALCGLVLQGVSLYHASHVVAVVHVPLPHFLRLSKKLEVQAGSYPSITGFPEGIYMIFIASGGVASVMAPLQSVSIFISLVPSSYSFNFTAMIVLTTWSSGVFFVASFPLVFTIL